jgi:hypothetical protein
MPHSMLVSTTNPILIIPILVTQFERDITIKSENRSDSCFSFSINPWLEPNIRLIVGFKLGLNQGI